MGRWEKVGNYSKVYIESDDEYAERISKVKHEEIITDSQLINLFADFILSSQDKLKKIGIEVNQELTDALTKRKK